MIVIDGKQLYTPGEAAALIGISQNALRSRIQRGTLKAVIVSGKQHVTGDALKEAAAQPVKRKGRRKNGGLGNNRPDKL